MNNSVDSIASSLCEFIAERTGMGTIDRSLDLLGSGVLDSLLVMGVVAFIEEQFQVHMQPSEIRPGTFQNINTLADWVTAQRRKAA